MNRNGPSHMEGVDDGGGTPTMNGGVAGRDGENGEKVDCLSFSLAFSLVWCRCERCAGCARLS